MNDLAGRIRAAVDDGFAAQLAWTAELVATPTVRPDADAAQDMIADALARRGYEIDRFGVDSPALRAHEGYGPMSDDHAAAENVVATYRPTVERGRSLILNGHLDVVPTGPPEQWSRSPWSAPVVDGWMYGRGAGDMKAGLAANVFALDALRAAGLAPTARVHVQSVVEEESTGNGSLAALLRGYTADAVVIPEPEDDMLVRANVGVIWFDATVTGVPGHVREGGRGVSAIEAAHAVMGELRALEAEWNARRAQHRYFADVEHPITINVGTIAGGDWRSSVPSWCTLGVRAGFYPGTPVEEAWAEIEAALARTGHSVTTTRTGFWSPGYVLEEGSDAERVLADAHREATGAALRTFTTPGYLDGRVFTLYAGIPTLVYGPVSEAIHGVDERVDVESVRRVTTAIALFVARWCGVEEQVVHP